MSTKVGSTFKFVVCTPLRENMPSEPLVRFQRKVSSLETTLGSSGLIRVNILGT